MGLTDLVHIIGFGCLILFAGVVVFALINEPIFDKAFKSSCNKIDMEYYESMDSDFCIDKNNKAHYVKIECDKLGYKKYNCTPRIISIGEIRTVGG